MESIIVEVLRCGEGYRTTTSKRTGPLFSRACRRVPGQRPEAVYVLESTVGLSPPIGSVQEGFLAFPLNALPEWSKVEARVLDHLSRLRKRIDSTELLAVAVRILALGGPTTGRLWLEEVLGFEPGERLAVAVLLLESPQGLGHDGGGLPEFLPGTTSAISRLRQHILDLPADLRNRRLAAYFGMLKNGVDPDRILCGFEIARGINPHYEFRSRTAGPALLKTELAGLAKLARRAGRADNWDRDLLLKYWKASQSRDEIIFLLDLPLRALSPDQLQAFLRVLEAAEDGLRRNLPRAGRQLWRATLQIEYQNRERFCDFIRAVVEMKNVAGHAGLLFGRALRLGATLCGPGINGAGKTGVHHAEILARCPPKYRAAWTQLPTSSHRRLEEDLRSSNKAELLIVGLRRLLEECPQLALNGIRHTPGRSLKLAAWLGGLRSSYVTRLRKLDPAGIFTKPLPGSLSSLLVLRARLRQQTPADGLPALPAGLRRSIENGQALRENSRGHYTANIRASLSAFAVEVAQRHVGQMMAVGLRIPSDQIEKLDETGWHAIRVLEWIDENRRPLRRVVRALVRGKIVQVLDHPANRAWLAARRRVQLDGWLSGPKLRRLSPDGREHVELGFEGSTLEILRMGTQVGSCLGIGGMFTGSVAAAALDANKRVVCARNANGDFLARQMVALTENEELIAFRVYPSDTKGSLLTYFREFDEALAQSLQVPLLGDSEASYEVRALVANDWYDDGPWQYSLGD